MKKAVFPGSFDPLTNGHLDIIKRSLQFFDSLVVAVGNNREKDKWLFKIEERLLFLEKVFDKESRVRIMSYEGLTVDFCKSLNTNIIVRGLRNTIDFEYEKNIALTNRKIGNIDTCFIHSSPKYSQISSSIIKDLIKHNKGYQVFVPEVVSKFIEKSRQ